MKTRSNRMTLTCLTAAAAVVMLVGGARQAAAVGETCFNDDDCPNAACGGEVCDWPNKGLKCRLAGEVEAGMDGWCMDDTDCKCKGEGATCNTTVYHCTFTKKAASGTGGASGTGTGGASGTGTGGATGTATGGSSGTATGGSSGTGGAKTGGSGDSGGCSVAGTPAAGSMALAGVALLGLVLGARRRARR